MSRATLVMCICTYRRPDGLQRLLSTLGELADSRISDVVVVDNDRQHAGLAVVEALRDELPFTLHSEAADGGGISAARNHAVDRALTLTPRFIAFLDDDEWPSERWLTELLRVQQQQDADAVGGPTRPSFPAGTDRTLQDNPYYGADLDLPDGAVCRLQAAGNFLVRADTLKLLAPQYFHPAFGASGGEDLAFFTQLAHRGARMHWAREAVVYEEVTQARLSRDWMRHRVITIANSRVRVAQLLEPARGAQMMRCARTVALGAQALLVSLAGALRMTSRQNGALLRWKFEGKLRAHLGGTTIRRDELS